MEMMQTVHIVGRDPKMAQEVCFVLFARFRTLSLSATTVDLRNDIGSCCRQYRRYEKAHFIHTSIDELLPYQQRVDLPRRTSPTLSQRTINSPHRPSPTAHAHRLSTPPRRPSHVARHPRFRTLQSRFPLVSSHSMSSPVLPLFAPRPRSLHVSMLALDPPPLSSRTIHALGLAIDTQIPHLDDLTAPFVLLTSIAGTRNTLIHRPPSSCYLVFDVTHKQFSPFFLFLHVRVWA